MKLWGGTLELPTGLGGELEDAGGKLEDLGDAGGNT